MRELPTALEMRRVRFAEEEAEGEGRILEKSDLD